MRTRIRNGKYTEREKSEHFSKKYSGSRPKHPGSKADKARRRRQGRSGSQVPLYRARRRAKSPVGWANFYPPLAGFAHAVYKHCDRVAAATEL